MDNREIARMLDETADILEILGENPFKVRAYRKAASNINRLETDLREIWAQGRLGELPGVGKAIRAKLEEIMTTGDLRYYRELQKKVPPGVTEMLAIPGLGPKTIGSIYTQTGIDSLEKLYQAARDKKLRELPGIGAKTEYNVKKGIEMLRSLGETVTLGTALPLAEEFKDYLKGYDYVEAVEIVGSIRRGKPLVGDIDLLVASNSENLVREAVKRFRRLREIGKESQGYIAGKLGLGVDFEVIIVSPSDFCLAVMLATGSRGHREKLVQEMEGLDVSGASTEADVYGLLSMQFIPPELREDRDEIEQARQHCLPELVKLGDLRGDLHIHTSWSDGASSLEEMVAAARRLGYSYMAVTEHSRSLSVSRGLDEERLMNQVRAIQEINRSLDDFTVLTGIEVDILKDGRLDLPDEILEQLDVVIASVHSHFRLSRQEQTERIISAIKNEHVDIIGHLTGRLLLRRPGYEVDVEAIIEQARKFRTALEINSHPDRLDISEEVARLARDAGVKVAINSDAHHHADMSLVTYGVLDARRGWLRKEDVINTLETGELLAYLRNK
ncbi:MAG: DNA polymerase/3'-5' exonuclease PolX [Syntrophomonadaceae bacterium]|nr:DNA polymerase/3'-5' exonuclease PolX [Syntrophomonadaceae bacterium]